MTFWSMARRDPATWSEDVHGLCGIVAVDNMAWGSSGRSRLTPPIGWRHKGVQYRT
jgi:hypothetical protein